MLGNLNTQGATQTTALPKKAWNLQQDHANRTDYLQNQTFAV